MSITAVPPMPSGQDSPVYDILMNLPEIGARRAADVPARIVSKPAIAENTEALTAVPEPVAAEMPLSHRVDGLLRHLSQDTTRFCGTMLMALPIWGVVAGLSRLLEHIGLLDSVATGTFLFAGLTATIFARLAWHRYGWKPAAARRRTAIGYALLGMTSIAVVPVVAVTLFIAISGATSVSSDAIPGTLSADVSDPNG